MNRLNELFRTLLVTLAVYFIMTSPSVCYAYFGWGFPYSIYGIIFCSFASVIIGNLISNKL